MTISHEKKLIFIHIPKNAGCSIIKSMGVENRFNDVSLDDYKIYYKEYWEEYTKFAVVRDPIDRFISVYKYSRMEKSDYIASSGKHAGDWPHEHYDLCKKFDINEYVDYLYRSKDKKSHNIWTIPQSFMVLNMKNEIEVDYIARFENLSEDLKKIGIDKIEKLNSSKINDNNLIKLTERSIGMLYKMYDIDYKNFSYTMDIGKTLLYC